MSIDDSEVEANEVVLVLVEVDEEGELLFLLQHMTSCFPLASMAQKNPSLPNAAEMGPNDPNPDVKMAEARRRRRRNTVVMRICMAGGGSWSLSSSSSSFSAPLVC